MATWEDVRRVALALPEVVEAASREQLLEWSIQDKLLAWERRLPAAQHGGPVLAVRVSDGGAKAAMMAADADTYFSTPHFDGSSAVLVRLDRVAVPELGELILEAWITCAPTQVATTYLDASQ